MTSARLRISPDPRSASHARRVVHAIVGEFVPPPKLDEFMVAVGEALANAVEHARARKHIDIRVRISNSGVSVLVLDQGNGFRRPSTFTLETEEERGRGLALMHICADVVALKSVLGLGTAVLLVRYFQKQNHSARPKKGAK